MKAGVVAELEERRDARVRLQPPIAGRASRRALTLYRHPFCPPRPAVCPPLPPVQLGELISGFQAVAQGFLARRRYRRAHGREDAIRVIQRNAMVFIDLYQWSWWKLYRQVRVPAPEPDPHSRGGRKPTSVLSTARRRPLPGMHRSSRCSKSSSATRSSASCAATWTSCSASTRRSTRPWPSSRPRCSSWKSRATSSRRTSRPPRTSSRKRARARTASRRNAGSSR